MDLESTYGMGGDRSLSPARIRVRARRVLRLDGRRPASGPVTVDTLAPEDFNESSIPQVYEPIYILYQYVSVCIDRYRGMYSCIQVGPFFSKYKNVCIGWYTHVFGHICTYMPRLLRPSRFWCSEAHSTESIQETKLLAGCLLVVT